MYFCETVFRFSLYSLISVKSSTFGTISFNQERESVLKYEFWQFVIYGKVEVDNWRSMKLFKTDFLLSEIAPHFSQKADVSEFSS